MTHKLELWMRQNGLSQREFASTYRISQPFLSQIISGARKPGAKAIQLLQKATRGELRVEDLRPDFKYKG